jgi:acyl carrier protein
MTDLDTADPALHTRLVDGICALLPDLLHREVPDASADTALMDALGMTSTAALELVLRLEESLELEISVEDLDREHFDTVGTLAGYVAANLLTVD